MKHRLLFQVKEVTVIPSRNKIHWCGIPDSNWYILPITPIPHILLVGPTGFEPVIYWLWANCINHYATSPVKLLFLSKNTTFTYKEKTFITIFLWPFIKIFLRNKSFWIIFKYILTFFKIFHFCSFFILVKIHVLWRSESPQALALYLRCTVTILPRGSCHTAERVTVSFSMISGS